MVNKSIVFLPSVESHKEIFDPVIKALSSHQNNHSIYLLGIKPLVSRNFHLEKNKFTFTYLGEKDSQGSNEVAEIKSWIVDTVKDIGNGGVLIVGNDAGRKKKIIISFFKSHGFKVVLAQDGWLVSEVINRPAKIYYNLFKRVVLKVLNHRLSPVKFMTNGFLGGQSDYFFVYSQFSKEQFVHSNLPESRVRIVGSPRHNILKLPIEAVEEKDDFILILTSMSFKKKHKKAIKLGVDWVIKNLKDKKVVIKIHPQEDIRDYEHYMSEHVRVVSKVGLNDLIRKSEKIFLFYSTVMLDLIILRKKFVQLAPNSLDKDIVGYNYSYPIVRRESDLMKVDKNLDSYGNMDLDQYYIKDADHNFNSIREFVHAIREIL